MPATKLAENNLAARDRMVLEYLPLVRHVALHIHKNLSKCMDLDDLIQSGVLGLLDAAGKFDPARNVQFDTYAKFRIRGAILDSLRGLDWASRDIRRRSKEVETATRDLANELQRYPTEDEVAGKLGLETERFRHILLGLRTSGLITASSRADKDQDLPDPEIEDTGWNQPDEICEQLRMDRFVNDAIASLPVRYARIARLYYIHDVRMKEIGVRFGVNESRISQILKESRKRMAVYFEERGIHASCALTSRAV